MSVPKVVGVKPDDSIGWRELERFLRSHQIGDLHSQWFRNQQARKGRNSGSAARLRAVWKEEDQG